MSLKVERGDWQTPLVLAREVLAWLPRGARSVVEPTCGEGAFLEAAADQFPDAALHGWDLNGAYVRVASRRVPRAHVRRANFFTVDWKRALKDLPEPILVVGNPPWVTSAVAEKNLPAKSNFKRLGGLDAITGKSNFDVSESMILTMLDALKGRDFTLAMLCKTSVARKIAERHGPDSLRRIDAAKHFDAAVDAVIFTCGTRPRARWPFEGTFMGLDRGVVVGDVDSVRLTEDLEGNCEPEWRSGLKHDCADVMELSLEGLNGLGQKTRLEPDVVFPLLKSSDVANDRPATRQVLVTQRSLSDDPSRLKKSAPRAWKYLRRHAAALENRRSAIYRGRPAFSIFGVGPYTFAPWKVAISGLYKRLAFRLIGPLNGRPVLLDDTCYFLPFDDEASARRALVALTSKPARSFLEARIFWDAKRPISKSLLQRLSLTKLEVFK